MDHKKTHQNLSFFIAAVWLINGLFCKVLNLVPRHQEIVGEILGDEYSRVLTVIIGVSEIVMSVWILSKYKSKINAIVQIVIIATMNSLEFILVPNLLLWGKFNTVLALLLILMIYYNEFILRKKN